MTWNLWSCLFICLSFLPHGSWALGGKASKHLMTKGCSGLWSSPPPVKPWLPWPQLSYRLSAQPLIPLSGTRGSRKSAITVHLQLLGFTSLCVTGYSLLSSCLPPFFPSCVSTRLSLVFLIAPLLFLSPSFCLHISHSCIVALPLDSIPTSLCILFSSSHTLPSLSLRLSHSAFQFYSLPLSSLCKSFLIHSQ